MWSELAVQASQSAPCICMLASPLWAVMCMVAASASASTTTRRIFLARHGETTWNAVARIQGTIDESRLTEAGVQQALELGRRLRDEEGGAIDNVICSSMTRARQTLEHIQAAFAETNTPLPSATVSREFREIELYEWEGMLKSELAEQYAERWGAWKSEPSNFAFSDGVFPLRELWKRGDRNWETLWRAGDATDGPAGRPHTTLVVAHGALNRAMLANIVGLPMDSFVDPDFQFTNCAWAEIELTSASAINMGKREFSMRWRWRHPEPSPWRTAAEEAAAVKAHEEALCASGLTAASRDAEAY